MIVDKKMNESNSNDEYIRCLHLFICKYLKLFFSITVRRLLIQRRDGNNSNDSDIDSKNKHER